MKKIKEIQNEDFKATLYKRDNGLVNQRYWSSGIRHVFLDEYRRLGYTSVIFDYEVTAFGSITSEFKDLSEEEIERGMFKLFSAPLGSINQEFLDNILI